MVKTNIVSLEKFKNTVGFTATFGCRWGNLKKANMDKVRLEKTAATVAEAIAQETNPNPDNAADKAAEKKAKNRMHLKKELIESPEYEAIKSFYGEIGAWIRGRTVPSFWKEGFRLVGLDGVNAIQSRMEKAVRDELPALVEKFLAAYPAQVEAAKNDFETFGQFNPLQYPTVEELRTSFDISWNWIAFTVPEALPESIRKSETDKLERQLTEAGEQITLALRQSFKELIDHAADKLKTEPGEKPKKIYETLTGNIYEFIETFKSRNITNDLDLAILVDKAREVLAPNGKQISTKTLRDYPATRAETQQQFDAIKTQLDTMITTTKGRRFNFEPEEATPEAATEATEAAAAPPVPEQAELATV